VDSRSETRWDRSSDKGVIVGRVFEEHSVESPGLVPDCSSVEVEPEGRGPAKLSIAD
jgi:hypothetical protein